MIATEAKAIGAPTMIAAQPPQLITASIAHDLGATTKPIERVAAVDAAASSTPSSLAAPGPLSNTQVTAPATTEVATPVALAANNKRVFVPAANGSTLSEVDRARFVQRVARAMQTADDRGGELRLRLSPPELGSLKLEVAVRDGVMSARLEAETTAARSLLIDNLPALRERLAEQNITIERFDVDVQNGSLGSPHEQSAGDADPSWRRGVANGRGGVAGQEPATDVAKPQAAHRVFRDDQLNVIV